MYCNFKSNIISNNGYKIVHNLNNLQNILNILKISKK